MQRHSDQLASRVREIRMEKFGADGVADLSQAMNIPARTWEHFENGVMIPAWRLLQLIELTGVEPHWLFTGKGDRYRILPMKSAAVLIANHVYTTPLSPVRKDGPD
jgi:hypothetical protein